MNSSASTTGRGWYSHPDTFRLKAVQALLVVDGTGICYYEGHPSQSKEGAGQGRLGLPQGDGDEDGYNLDLPQGDKDDDGYNSPQGDGDEHGYN